jgi:hypothetical protein
MAKLLRNIAQCRNCGDIIESKERWDFVACQCFLDEPGTTGIYRDGGTDYIRNGGNLANIIDLSEWELEYKHDSRL